MKTPDGAPHPWNGTALIERSDRARLWVAGADRARFLHNLTTNEIKRLASGAGVEAFVTSPQGKTLAYVIIHALEDRLLVRADPGGLEHALPHFQKYGALDDVALDDAAASTREIHLAGPGPFPDWLASIPLAAEYSHATAIMNGHAVLAIRESPTGFPGWTLIAPAAAHQALLDQIRAAADVRELDRDSVEGLRIAAGIPVFGREVTPANLPQELGRDDRAISFVKGCYLGQETVARIDAVGHVNRVLKGLRFETDAVPAAGARLVDQDKTVGTATSAARSPYDGAAIALAFVKTSHARAGTRLAVPSPGAESPSWAVVADLPITGATRSP